MRKAAGMPEGMYLSGCTEKQRKEYLRTHPKVAAAVAEATRKAA